MVGGKKRKRIIKFLKTEYKIGDEVPVSAIYECSECWNVTAFKKGEHFTHCEEHEKDPEQDWYRTNQFIHFVTKNVNTEYEKIETFGVKASDWVAEFVGSWTFIISFGLIMYLWIGANIYGWTHQWDPYPFILLNLVLSTIAAIQAPLIMMSQNRQGQKSELRAELDYQTNLKTEKDVAEVLSILRQMQEEERLIGQKTSEVLEDANIILQRSKKRKKGRKHEAREKKADQIMEEAGIETVVPSENEEENS